MLESLTTERLVLRPVDAGDRPFYVSLYGDPVVMRHIGLGVQSAQDATRMMLAKAGTTALYGFGNWTVCLRDGTAIGEFGFFDAGRGAAFDLGDAVEAGWSFLPQWWGQGYGSEAVAAAHAWFDATHAGGESFVLISAGNAASLRVAQKTGYGAGAVVDYQGVANHLLRRAALSTA